MTKKERYKFTIDYFKTHAPNAETELIYDDPYQLLVSVILSAQCTDKRVNLTTPSIFEKYPDVYALSKAEEEDLFQLIKSISYPNNKTKHLIGMAKMVVEKFNGQIPMTVDELTELPGAGRKTANVITSVIDQQPNTEIQSQPIYFFQIACSDHRLTAKPEHNPLRLVSIARWNHPFPSRTGP